MSRGKVSSNDTYALLDCPTVRLNFAMIIFQLSCRLMTSQKSIDKLTIAEMTLNSDCLQMILAGKPAVIVWDHLRSNRKHIYGHTTRLQHLQSSACKHQ